MEYGFQRYERPVILRNHLHLGGENPAGEQIRVNSLYIERNEKPWIGIMGEMHYCRYRREDWKEELCKMKAGGITAVAAYVFWIYHEQEEGIYDFRGDNDLRAFVELCAELGLDAVVRIGPWCHGEVRNGGLPDWLLEKPYKLRDTNPQFMEQVRIWYQRIAEELAGLYYKDGGPIVAIQLENELVDDAEYLRQLKILAIECGMIVPIYTVTGWNSSAGARIPVEEVIPLFGGYCDAPWDGGTQKLPPSNHYFFTGIRNDSAIGKDLIAVEKEGDWQLPYERYPYATCELGGGLQNTYKRRYLIEGMDIYAITLIKICEGTNLLGYYMYHGGTNQMGRKSTLQESKATGYPNDYPILSYDFQAPLSEYGEIREQYRLLNMLHLFVQDFQENLAEMTYVPSAVPVKREDCRTLRCGLRTNGESGYLFVNHYQRREELKDVEQAELKVGDLRFPAIDVKGAVSFFFPYAMKLEGEVLQLATAQPLCRMGNTFFFVEIPGIPAEYQIEGKVYRAQAGKDRQLCVGESRLVTLTWEEARFVRRLEGRLCLGQQCDLYLLEGRIRAVQPGGHTFFEWEEDGFRERRLEEKEYNSSYSLKKLDRPAFTPDKDCLEELELGGAAEQTWYELSVEDGEGFLTLELPCDILQVYTDGQLAADDFYYGRGRRLPKRLLYKKTCHVVTAGVKSQGYLEY